MKTTKKRAVEIMLDPANARVHDERNQKVIENKQTKGERDGKQISKSSGRRMS